MLGRSTSWRRFLRAHPVEEVVVASRKTPPDRLYRLEVTCAARGVVVLRASVRLE